MSPGTVIPCVGAIVHDAEGRLLLIKRGHAPAAGLWSLPGGRVEGGESTERAVVREVGEETGLEVEVLAEVGSIEIPRQDGHVYAVRDFACRVIGGTLRAGDDAADARWVSFDDLATLDTSPGLIDALRGWGVLPDAETDAEAP